MTWHSQEYRDYINSDAWRAKRLQALRAAHYTCQACGKQAVRFEVHHLTYARLGAEYLSDLRVLCTTCHARADQQRKKDKHYGRIPEPRPGATGQRGSRFPGH